MKDGWYVKQLLLTRDQIRGNLVQSTELANVYAALIATASTLDDVNLLEASVSINFEDDDLYSDLLSVEIKIREMLELGLFDSKEEKLIVAILDGVPIPNLDGYIKISKLTRLTTLDRIYAKVAFFMGGYFTNAGFIERFLDRYSYRFNNNTLRKLYNILGENIND